MVYVNDRNLEAAIQTFEKQSESTKKDFLRQRFFHTNNWKRRSGKKREQKKR